MVKLNKLGLLCVVLALVVAGCGKKKCTGDVCTKNKKMAKADLPVKEEAENLLDESDISDFSFVDGEDKAKNAKKTEVANADDVELDTEAPATDQERAASAFKTVHFDFNKNVIRGDQREVVALDSEIAKTAVEKGKKVVIEGHCDQIGSAAYNLALSQRRAEAVKEAMLEQGVAAENVKTLGLGYEHPIVWSDQKNRKALIAELAPNRRAEVLTN
jgi:outer membrane protein OmpA-like peptidoglycan-associated protein